MKLRMCFVALFLAVSATTAIAQTSNAGQRALEEAKKYSGQTLNMTWPAGVGALDAKAYTVPIWEKATGVKVNVIETPIADMFAKVTAEHRARTGAFDVVSIVPSWLADMALARVIEPLDPFVKKYGFTEELQGLEPAYRDNQMRWDGKIYGIPDDGDVLILYYRKDLFADAENRTAFKAKYGYDLAPPKTWEQFADIGNFFTAKYAPDLYGAGMIRRACYDEIARIPLIIYHPRFASCAGQHRRALTQAIDVMPTLLDMFDVEVPATVRGRSLLPLMQEDRPHREAAIFGYWGGAINVTDGRYTYFRYPEGDARDTQLYLYTLVPFFIPRFLDLRELREWEQGPAFSFTKGIRTMKIPSRPRSVRNDNPSEYWRDARTVLFDTLEDPGQLRALDAPQIESQMGHLIARTMYEDEAPPEMFQRLGLDGLTPTAPRSRTS